MNKKKISIVVPCYNEEKSVHTMTQTVTKMFSSGGALERYDYELIFADDFSTDRTREELRKICAENRKVKAILNAKNFGYTRNVFYTLTQGTGDAVFMVFGDLQDPPELLPQFVEQWERGHKLVIGQKTQSEESRFVFFLRTLFYKMMDSFSNVQQIQHFNGFGLYDRIFVDVMREIKDPTPYLKGLVGEFGMQMTILAYEQRKSARGKSNVNFWKAYDAAMVGITSYTKTLMRVATFLGVGVGISGVLFALFTLVNKIANWDSYATGTATIIICVLLIGAVQLFFTGILGEYILGINTRMLDRPLVVPEEKLNFEDGGENV